MQTERRAVYRRHPALQGRRSGFKRRKQTVETAVDYRNHEIQRREVKRRVVVDRRSFFQ